MTEYDVQAADFIKKSGVKITITRDGDVQGFPFDDHDKMWHNTYLVTMSRAGKQYRFPFYDSNYNWRNGKRPSRYDVLACLQKYDVGTLDDFAAEYGYELTWENHKRVKKIWKGCKEQYERLLELFGEDLMEDLREIN